jgi:Carboxypeptidase regulatory-like domain
MRFLRPVLVAAVLATAAAGPVYAQGVGQLFGRVTDGSGAVMAGVVVTVAGDGLPQPLAAVTTRTGTYTFRRVPIGTYSVTFELSGFKTITRPITLTAGQDGTVNVQMEVGHPLVATKKTTTGGDFTEDQMLKVPTARDPWQVINMAPAVVLSGVNVGGSASGQQLIPAAFGQSGSVQWNLEGGTITDMSANASPLYFNFDSIQEIQVVTSGGDVSVQSAGVFINLITKSGSNVVKGAADLTFENSALQGQNVTEAQFNSAVTNGPGLSGDPLHRIANYDGDIGGPIRKNTLWYWVSSDYQDIEASDPNVFNTSLPGCNPPPRTFAQLSQVQSCLENGKTTIQDFNGKLTYQLNQANKVQVLFQSDRKLRTDIGANSTTAPEATLSQYGAGGIWHFQNPTVQLTHTWLPTDRLVLVNHVTYVRNGFLQDYHDYPTCGSSTYARDFAGQDPTDPTCLWNIQSLFNISTGAISRAPFYSYDTQRPSWEVKTDDNYLVSHFLGGDHALKFGMGWRKDPVLTFEHYSGGAEALVQSLTACDSFVSNCTGAPSIGITPVEANLYRDSLINHNWWTWNSFIQDTYTSGRLTVNGGVREDWQDSRFLGGCVQANTIMPLVLPQQCQGAVGTGHPFNNFSPRVAATYDLTGHGTTAVHASFSYYHQTEIVLADGLSSLSAIEASWGFLDNDPCDVRDACWFDVNGDDIVQANELTGTPSLPSSFVNGVQTAAPQVDPNLKLNRTREAVVGLEHRLEGDLLVSVDYTHRYTDFGSLQYLVGTQPGTPGFPASTPWVGPFTFTDPQTGISAPYYTLCAGCTLPQGGQITATSVDYQTYNGASVTLTKRLAHRWQGSVSYQWNDFRAFTPPGGFATVPSGNTLIGDPTGVQFTSGFTNNTPRYTVKGYASWDTPWYGLSAAANWNLTDGAVRTEAIAGPGDVFNCPPGTPLLQCSLIAYTTLPFEDVGTSRLPAINLLDLSVSKNLDVGRQRLTVILNCFNALNINTVTAFQSDVVSYNGLNGAPNTFNAISSIVPPRVFRIDLRYAF